MPVLSVTLKLSGKVIFRESLILHKQVRSSLATLLSRAMSCSVSDVTRNLRLMSPAAGGGGGGQQHRQLVVLLAWLNAKQKHTMKYASFYMDRGFDVLTVNITPWQLLWPVSGSQVVADDLLRFLKEKRAYGSVLLHGFSVGAYVWSEALVKVRDDPEAYRPALDGIVGQVWDSAADITEIPVGFPQALFPRNPILQSAFRKYIRYHMQKFHNAATSHYIRASQIFYSGYLRVPALFLLSKTDPIGALGSNTRCREGWEALGIKTYMKCWDKSPHVGHYRKHPEEYLGELSAFLNRLNQDAHASKIRAKL
ncbi:uncharacterized protein LOC134539693 [Bacillus rossius redtenbacheri]|uniref:uncharacterized protein LOC134539693 n=1 Tax=Bacillus rossius redtenbacheri TaxID=93214 RepID=UPI002FDCC4B2